MKPRLLIAVLCLLPTLADAQGTKPLRLHVFTQTHASGLTDADTLRRQQIVKGIEDKLRKNRSVQLVASANEATATLEVTGTVTSETVNNAFFIGAAGIGNQKKSQHATLRVGDFQTDFAAPKGRPADGFTKLLLDWIKANRARLEAQ